MLWDMILFIVFPYFAIVFAIAGGIYRYVTDKYSYSSFSTQLLENRMLFWGIFIFHYSIIVILLAHLWEGCVPRASIAAVSSPASLFVLEIVGFILSYLAIAGLIILFLRRLTRAKARRVTTFWDWLLVTVLIVQIALGIYVAHIYSWGSVWYPATVSPWFYSLLYLRPDYSTIVDLPWIVKAHFFNGWLVIFLFPLTRLVHIVTIPISYLWRPFQVVIWNSWHGLRRKV